MTALLGVLIEYSILLGQMFSTDCDCQFLSLSFLNFRANYHRMGQFQRTRVQSPDNAHRLSNSNIPHILSANLRLEAIRDPGIVQSLDALRQRPLQNDVKGELVIVGGKNLGFALSSIAKRPDFFEKDFLLERLAAAGGSARGEMPAGWVVVSIIGKKRDKNKKTYHTRDMPVRDSFRCLIFSGSDRHRTSVPRRWALAASCSLPRKTTYRSSSLRLLEIA